MEYRLARADDAKAIRDIYAPVVEETVISFEFEPPGVEEMTRRMAAVTPQYPWLVAEDRGAVAGYAYAGRHSDRDAYGWSVDVSVYLAVDQRGRGLGRALYERLLELLRLQGFGSAYAGITLPNPASVGLHEAMGFTPVGVYRDVGWKMGRWHDVGWWQRPLNPPNGADPAPPRTVPELTPDEVAQALAG